MDEGLDKKREELLKNVKSFLSPGKKQDAEKEQTENRQQILHSLKQKKEWIISFVLAVIVWFSSAIRLKNLHLLKDASNGEYIPLALDPHLFLKYARYITEHGSLLAHDPTRFVPLGTSTVSYVFMSSFLVYLHKFLQIFKPSMTLEEAVVIYPVVCFAIGLVFFFLLARRLFDYQVGLLATLFLAVVPAYLHRTMAGFADHEALGIMFMFMALYFYVLGWQSQSLKKTIGWGAMAGLFTGFMGLTWGGWKFLILIISLFVLIEFFFNKLEKKDLYQYTAWVILFVLATTTWIPMFSIKLLLGSFTTSIAFLVLFMLLVDFFLFKQDTLRLKTKIEKKMPLSVASFVVSLVLGLLLLTVVIGPGALAEKAQEVSDNLLHPLGNDRWQLTVAEQHQPYFTTWVSHFGPRWFNIPLYLTLFMVGSIILFYNLVRKNTKRLQMTFAYIVFILAFTMSRHSPGSLFNGTNTISKLVYLGSLGLFMLLAVLYYFKTFYKERAEHEKILKWDKRYIFVLIWFLIMVVAARGAERLFFIFAPITAIMAAYGSVELLDIITKIKKKAMFYVAIIVLLLVIFSPFAFPGKGIVPKFTKDITEQATYTGPAYDQFWQKAGEWVRQNIPEDAVFGHWWDYGYWVQNGFRRASVLDGANKIKYWNYLMGRHVLTAQSQTEALEFLKVHNTTHYLIVSDEVGKYTAYSSIGSDENYDRYSWIETFVMNPEGSQERRNGTTLMYQGSFTLDDDFMWEDKIFPRYQSGVGAVFLPIKQSETVDQEGKPLIKTIYEQPTVALVYRGQRTDVPLKCLYAEDKVYLYEGPGYEGCFRLIPILQNNGQLQHPVGAGLFISEEGFRALWVNLYLLEQRNPQYDTSAFDLVYGQKQNGIPLAVFQNRLIGPIKIWEINYPEGFTVDEATRQKYLGGNELLPDYFFKVN